MKPIDYEGSGDGLRASYYRVKEGTNYFLIYYKNSSVLRRDPKDAWRVLGPAKFTKTGTELKEWCLSMDNQYSTDVLPDSGRADDYLASEPNDNTKMVV